MHGTAAGSHRPSMGRVIVLAVTVVAVIVVLIPVVWAITGSLKTEAEYREIPIHVLPRTISFDAYQAVLADGRLPRAFLMSVAVAVLEVTAVLLTSAVAGYVFARKLFWGKDALFLFVLASTMVPFTMLLIPLYIQFVDVGFTNNLLAVMLPTAVSAYGIFLCRQFIRGIPRDLFDAAAIDGAGDTMVLREIVLPIAKPVLSALAIFTVIASFNSLLWPLVILSDASLFTLPIVLASYARQGESIIWTQILAAAIIGAIPMVVAFLVLRRNFVKGISLTGLGGH